MVGIVTFKCDSLSADMVPFTSGNTTEIEKAVFEERVSKMGNKICCFQQEGQLS